MFYSFFPAAAIFSSQIVGVGESSLEKIPVKDFVFLKIGLYLKHPAVVVFLPTQEVTLSIKSLAIILLQALANHSVHM